MPPPPPQQQQQQQQQLVIIGGGGLGLEVAWMVEEASAAGEPHELLGFLDDDASTHGQQLGGRYPVLGGVDMLPELAGRGVAVVCALGSPNARARAAARAEAVGARFASVVGPRVCMPRRERAHPSPPRLGEGCMVLGLSVVDVDTSIGRHALLLGNVLVGHGSTIGDYASLLPGATVCGECRVGAGSVIGAGATVIQGVTVGAGCVVGAGASVVRDVPDGCTVAGVPARVIAGPSPDGAWREWAADGRHRRRKQASGEEQGVPERREGDGEGGTGRVRSRL